MFYLILQIPHAVAMSELLVGGPALGQYPALESRHGEEQVGVVLGVDRDEARLPLDGRQRPGQTQVWSLSSLKVSWQVLGKT